MVYFNSERKKDVKKVQGLRNGQEAKPVKEMLLQSTRTINGSLVWNSSGEQYVFQSIFRMRFAICILRRIIDSTEFHEGLI